MVKITRCTQIFGFVTNGLLFLAFIFFISATSGPSWTRNLTANPKFQQGLWIYCQNNVNDSIILDICGNTLDFCGYAGHPCDKIRYAQAFSLISIVASFFTLYLSIRCTFYEKTEYIKWVMLSAFTTALFGILCMVTYSSEELYKHDYGWAFNLHIAGWIFCLIAGFLVVFSL